MAGTELMTFDQVEKTAIAVSKSKLFPNWDTPEKVMTLMLLCKSEGRDPLSAMNRYDLISGRVAKRSNAMLEDFIIAGGKVEWMKTDAFEARAKFYPPNGIPLELAVTRKEMETAGLTSKDNWRKYPSQMLRARLISSALKMCYPTSTGQLYTPEEVIDMEPTKEAPKTVTPMFTTPPVEPGQKVSVTVTSNSTTEPPPIDIKAEVTDAAINPSFAPTGAAPTNPPPNPFWEFINALDPDKTLKYLKGLKWIPENGKLDDLSEAYQAKIMQKPEGFKKKVEAVK